MRTNYNGRIPKIPNIEMPDVVSFGGLEEALKEAEIHEEQFLRYMKESGNTVKKYIDEEGFAVREVISADGKLKSIIKKRYINGNYENRLTIWNDGKIICNDVKKYQMENSKSGGGCLVALVVIVLIAIAMVLIITTII